jgi:hypothetical protein
LADLTPSIWAHTSLHRVIAAGANVEPREACRREKFEKRRAHCFECERLVLLDKQRGMLLILRLQKNIFLK